MNTVCAECGTERYGQTHDGVVCELTQFYKSAYKYGLAPLRYRFLDKFGPSDYYISRVNRELRDVWPRISYRSFVNSGFILDVFVEEWSIPAIIHYLDNDGMAGLSLGEYLIKMKNG